MADQGSRDESEKPDIQFVMKRSDNPPETIKIRFAIFWDGDLTVTNTWPYAIILDRLEFLDIPRSVDVWQERGSHKAHPADAKSDCRSVIFQVAEVLDPKQSYQTRLHLQTPGLTVELEGASLPPSDLEFRIKLHYTRHGFQEEVVTGTIVSACHYSEDR